MLTFCCVAIMLAVAYSMYNEGIFTAVVMLVNVVLAGFLCYSVWEPAADYLEPLVKGTFLAGMEDHLAMVLSFAVFLVLLRLATNSLTRLVVEFNPNLHRYGGALVGLFTGYLLAGFLVCAAETLPLSRNFMGFAPRAENEGEWRQYFPPDRVWSAMMFRAGAHSLSWKYTQPGAADPYDRFLTFDRHGTFELHYERYRRYEEKDGKKRPPLPWQKEIN